MSIYTVHGFEFLLGANDWSGLCCSLYLTKDQGARKEQAELHAEIRGHNTEIGAYPDPDGE